MALFPIKLPPGIFRAGTEQQSAGRWFDCNLVRFYQNDILPIGGWRSKGLTSVTGKGRAIWSWHDNSSLTWAAVGTESNLYAMTRNGTVSDITPSGFTPGRADAVAAGGYGGGTYGSGLYGTPRADDSEIQDASMWVLDTWGEDLVGVMSDDGIIYQWFLDIGTPAVAVTNAPSATALLVTQDRILMALGAENVPRRVKWSDQEDDTVWTPDATNQAGDFDLQTNGRLLFGLRVTGGNLLLTDLDCWLAAYTGDALVYNFNKKGSGCGAISRGAGINLDAQAVWMGQNGFWLYNGFVAPLPCDVWDYVFSNLNQQQKSKITCELNSQFGEVTWHYPSGGSIEIDSYVTWNFRENHWSIGQMVRLSGVDAGVTPYSLRVDASGVIYEHEVGNAYSGAMPYLTGGPIEIGNGDNVQYAQALIPDDRTVGDVSATFYVRFYPDDAATSFGPYTLTSKTDLRFGGREIKVRFDGVTQSDWRIGEPKIDLLRGGMR